VVSTNTDAIHLWRALGFRLPDGSTVSHFVTSRALS
jgi:hypothetical protein